MAIFDFKERDIRDDRKEHKSVTAGSVVKYMVLPRILPRLAELISTGFYTFAFFMACVLSTIRLIPASHEYLRPQNIGRFGIVQVLATAANNLEFRKENADQIIVFGIVVTALALLALQIFSLLLTFVMAPAMAQIATILNPYPGFVPAGAAGTGVNGEFDIAMILLDRVFGVPGLFDSCVSLGIPCTGINADGLNATNEVQTTIGTFPWPFHNGLHQMYLFYSLALLIIGLLIFIYFIMVILIETAQTGTPFGRRFNSVWAPIRMVVAIGLLVPFAFGMNSAQFITLYAAKWGSGLATTAWFQFNASLTKLTTEQQLLGVPKGPSAMQLISFMSLAIACQHMEETYFPWDTEAFTGHTPAVTPVSRLVDGWLVKNDPTKANQIELFTATDFAGAMNFYNNGNVIIRFGDEDPSYTEPTGPVFYGGEKALVKRSCGELLLTTTDMGLAGPAYMNQGWYELTNAMWGAGSGLLPTSSAPGAQDCNGIVDFDDFYLALMNSSQQWVDSRMKTSGSAAGGVGVTDYFTTADTKQSMLTGVSNVIQCLVNNAVLEERASNVYDIPPELLMRGWAGAGIWYNKIAAANGALATAARNIPKVTAYPEVMERVAKAKLRVDPNVSADDIYNPTINEGKILNLPRGEQEVLAAQVMYDLYRFWLTDLERVGRPSASGNFFGKMLMNLFGLEGLYSITANNDVHPLAKLVSVGKGLIDSTITNLTGGTVAIFGGAIIGMADHPLAKLGPQLGEVAGDIMFSLATVGLTAGFVLYYVIPFLPFIYFFFAVGNWLKTVFEAMVGVPLWALAHIRIDGNGLPGDAAINGYYLIFEIFLRPIMIIFGLIAGISVFAAMAAVLHDIWDIVVANVGGTGAEEQASLTESIRGPVDKLFYLVVYTIILYMMAISSFKLVELIPQQILRWLGASVPTFVDQSQDAAGGLVQYAAIGGGHMFGQITGSTKQAMSQMGSALSK